MMVPPLIALLHYIVLMLKSSIIHFRVNSILPKHPPLYDVLFAYSCIHAIDAHLIGPASLADLFFIHISTFHLRLQWPHSLGHTLLPYHFVM